EAAHAMFADTDLKKQFLQIGGGAARIFGTDGRSLAEPLSPTEEGIIYADIDYGAILAAKNAADPVGHYSRPDVMRLLFNPSANPRVVGRASVALTVPDPDLELSLETGV